MKKTCLAVLTVLLLAVSCTEKAPVGKLTESGLDIMIFETDVNGKKVGLCVLKNSN